MEDQVPRCYFVDIAFQFFSVKASQGSLAILFLVHRNRLSRILEAHAKVGEILEPPGKPRIQLFPVVNLNHFAAAQFVLHQKNAGSHKIETNCKDQEVIHQKCGVLQNDIFITRNKVPRCTRQITGARGGR